MDQNKTDTKNTYCIISFIYNSGVYKLVHSDRARAGVGGFEAGQRAGRWEDYKGYEETLRSDGCFHCLDCDEVLQVYKYGKCIKLHPSNLHICLY